ncbi:MAG: hypothetical protein C0598_07965, partial [Marinilabiliales bacterium]
LGEIEVELENNSNPYFKFYTDSSAMKTIIKGISKAGIKSLEIEQMEMNESEISMSFEMENPAQVLGNYHRYKLPTASNGVDSWHMNILTQQRTSPLEIPHLLSEKYEYTIVLPANANLLEKPMVRNYKYDFGSVNISIEQNNTEVTVVREITFNKTTISIAEYPKFKDMMNLWNNEKYRFVIYKVFD